MSSQYDTFDEEDDGWLPPFITDSFIYQLLTSMQTVIILLFVGIFVAYMGVFAFWSAPFYTSVRNLSWDIQDATMNNLLHRIEDNLLAHENYVDRIAVELEHNQQIVSNRTRLKEYVIDAFRRTHVQNPSIKSLAIIDFQNPSFISIVRDRANYTNDDSDEELTSLFYSFDNADDPGNGTLEFLDDAMEETGDSHPYLFDFLKFDWVTQVLNDSSKPTMTWFASFLMDDAQYGHGNHSLSSVSRMIYDTDGTLLFSVTCSLSSLQLSEQLEKVVHNRISIVYELETSKVIASSDERIQIVNNNTLSRLSDVRTREPRELIKHVSKNFDPYAIDNMQTKRSHYFDGPKGSRYLVNVGRIMHPGGLDWIVILATNRNNLVFQPWVAFISATIVGGIFLILGLTIGISASFWLTSPIKQLKSEMEKVSDLQLDKVVDLDESSFSEMKSIQRTFKSTVERLKEYRSFIPAHLLNELEGNEVEEVSSSKQEPPIKKLHFSGSQRTLHAAYHTSMRERREAMFKIGLNERPISYIYGKIDNIEEMLTVMKPDEWAVRVHREMIEKLAKIAFDFKAHFQFEVDSFELFFNTTNETKDYQEKACAAASLVSDQFKKLSSASDLNVNVQLRLCVMSMRAFCGNIGCENNKKTIAWSPVMASRAKECYSICSQWQIDLLIDQETHSRVSREYMCRPVMDINLDASSHNDDGHGSSFAFITDRLYQLGPKHQKASGEEWMYELEKDEHNARWDPYIRAYEDLVKKDYESAMRGFQDFYDKNPDDDLTLRQIEALKRKFNGQVSEFNDI